MATVCVLVPLGPPCTDVTGVRAGDLNLITATIRRKGIPVNLTGLTLKAQARKTAVDATVALTAVVTVLDAANGEISIRWPGDAVRTLLAGAAKWSGVWDLEASQPGTDPSTLTEGKITCVSDVTRT
jgi:hypothetical protein